MADENKQIVLTEQQLKEMSAGLIVAAIKEMGLDAIDLKNRIIPDGTEQKQLQLDPKARTANFLKGLLHNSKEEINKALVVSGTALGQNEATQSEGGYFVPDEIDYAIRRVVKEHGISTELFGSTPMGKSTKLTETFLTSGVSVSFVGEGGIKPLTKASFTQKSATVKKVAGITLLTEEVIEDANINLIDYLVTLFGEAIAEAKDNVCMLADGTANYGGFTGIWNDTNIASVTLSAGQTTLAKLTYDDIVAIKNSVPVNTDQRLNLTWLFGRNVLTALETLKDGDGRYILPVNRSLDNLLGIPFKVTESVPDISAGAPIMMLGNFKKSSTILEKGGTTMKMSGEATIYDSGSEKLVSLFQTNQKAVLAEQRFGFFTHMPEYAKKLKLSAV